MNSSKTASFQAEKNGTGEKKKMQNNISKKVHFILKLTGTVNT